MLKRRTDVSLRTTSSKKKGPDSAFLAAVGLGNEIGAVACLFYLFLLEKERGGGLG